MRGIMTIEILRDILLRLVDDPETPDEELKPCECVSTAHCALISVLIEAHRHFDLICGTSTGGLLALLFGRLGMSIAEASKCYKELGVKIFGPESKTASGSSRRRTSSSTRSNTKPSSPSSAKRSTSSCPSTPSARCVAPFG